MFVHYTAIQGEGPHFNEGDIVEFDIVDSDKGLQATNVVKLKSKSRYGGILVYFGRFQEI